MRSQRVGHDWANFTCLEWRSSSLEWRASCPNIFTKHMLCVRHCSRHCAKSLQSCLTLQPYGLEPVRLLCPWDSPGKKSGVGFHALLQGISQPRDWTHISCGSYIGGGFFFTTEPPEKPILDPRTQQIVLKKISILLGCCIRIEGAGGRT